MEDKAIVELFWQRSDRAIAETEQKYGAYCHTIAYNICQDRRDAEECVNDTWFRAWNRMPDERPNALAAFLGAICRNFALDKYRSGRRKKRGGGETELALSELEECVSDPMNVERAVEEKEVLRALNAFLAALPEKERTIFVSRYWYVAPVSEIAERLGCSQGKVKMTLHRLRGRLRAALQEEGLC